MRSIPLLSLPFLFAVLLPAAAANGSTIAAGSALENWPKGPGVVVGYVTWTAAAGEANAAELRVGATTVAVRDDGAPVTAGSGCAPAADGWVECRLPVAAQTSVTADLGDGDDALRVSDERGVPPTTTVKAGAGADRVELLRGSARVDGGAGDDLLTGGPQDDQLDGGPGSDRLLGGGGDDTLTGDPYGGPYAADQLDGGDGARDTASYAARAGGVVVDLAAGSGGQPGEGDLLRALENATGGAGADVLRGDDGPNALNGWTTSGPQAELLDGRGGDDVLTGGGGGATAVRIAGGDGDDAIEALGRGSIDAGAGDDAIGGELVGALTCGTGRDRYAADERTHSRAVVSGDCERVDTSELRFSALRLLPRRLTFVVGRIGRDSEACAVRLRLRTAGAGRGRVLATQTLRFSADGLGPGRRRSARFAAAAGLPARVRVEGRPLFCDRGPRPRADDSFEAESFPLGRDPLARAPARASAGAG